MNLQDVRYPREKKQAVRALLVQEAKKITKRVPWWRKPAALTFAGLIIAGTTAGGLYAAMAPVEDKREIRCYYAADLTTEYPEPGLPGQTRPPYSTTGIESLEFDARNNPTPEDPRAGLLQVSDPINQCSRVWDLGLMNLKGINDDLIPSDFVSPAADPSAERPSAPVSGKDQNGNPLYENPDIKAAGNFIPHLTECVVENSVAVIPGPAEVCARLGIPALEK